MSAAKSKRRAKKVGSKGIAYMKSTFNNTLVTVTDVNGNTVSWASSGVRGFRDGSLWYGASASNTSAGMGRVRADMAAERRTTAEGGPISFFSVGKPRWPSTLATQNKVTSGPSGEHQAWLRKAL